MAEVVVFGVVAADIVLRVQRIPGPGDHVNAEALGWRIGGSSANVACGLSMAGHHVRLVGPVGRDSMGDNLLAELEQYGVETEYTFRADAASPRTPLPFTSGSSVSACPVFSVVLRAGHDFGWRSGTDLNATRPLL